MVTLSLDQRDINNLCEIIRMATRAGYAKASEASFDIVMKLHEAIAKANAPQPAEQENE
jgi:hypothetical protein